MSTSSTAAVIGPYRSVTPKGSKVAVPSQPLLNSTINPKEAAPTPTPLDLPPQLGQRRTGSPLLVKRNTNLPPPAISSTNSAATISAKQHGAPRRAATPPPHPSCALDVLHLPRPHADHGRHHLSAIGAGRQAVPHRARSPRASNTGEAPSKQVQEHPQQGASDSQIPRVGSASASLESLPDVSAESNSTAPRPRVPVTPGGGMNVPVIHLDNFEDQPPIKTVLTSPRSLQVCGRFGVHPSELVARPLSHFAAPGVPQSVAKLRHQHFAAKRAEKLALLREERHCMPEPSSAPPSANASTSAGYLFPKPAASSSRPPSPRASSGGAAQRPPSPRSRTPTGGVAAAALPRTPMGAAAAVARDPRQPPIAQHRARAILHANAKREEVKRRASERDLRAVAAAAARQSERERQAEARVEARLNEKLQSLEMQRLRREDAMDRVRQLGRIKQYNADLRAMQWEQKRMDGESRRQDPYALLAAREEYRTPSQRLERARSSSALSRTPSAASAGRMGY